MKSTSYRSIRGNIAFDNALSLPTKQTPDSSGLQLIAPGGATSDMAGDNTGPTLLKAAKKSYTAFLQHPISRGGVAR